MRWTHESRQEPGRGAGKPEEPFKSRMTILFGEKNYVSITWRKKVNL